MRLLWLLGVGCAAVPVRAAVVLKSGSGSLRVKTVRANTVIQNGVATTDLVWTFAQTNRSQGNEAQFFYGAPPRGIVTFFAYWFGGERVVARVVEREKAAAIYNGLMEQNIDPALIELDGKNTFRARLFPVAPGADVRVEMHLVQPLEATPNGQKWVLPLEQSFVAPRRLSQWIAAPKAVAPFYDDVEVHVRCRDKGTVNGSGAIFSRGEWTWKARNWKANQDFVVQWQRPAVNLRADLSWCRVDGRDGYFSLLLTPSQTLRRPHLHLSGVSTFDVFPPKIETLHAGENVLICGRFRGVGRAKVSLQDGARTLFTSIVFGAGRGAGTVAAKLWASRELVALGADERNRSRVVALSKRWNLPSSQTSWLAVPKAEQTGYAYLQREAEAARISRQIVSDLVLNRASRAHQNQAKLARLFDPQKASGTRQEWVNAVIAGAFSSFSDDLARAIVLEQLETYPNEARLATMRTQLNIVVQTSKPWIAKEPHIQLLTPEDCVTFAKRWMVLEREQRLAPDYVQAVINEGKQSSHAVELKKQLDFLRSLRGEDDYVVEGAFYQMLRMPLHQLVYAKLLEEKQPHPDKAKIAQS